MDGVQILAVFAISLKKSTPQVIKMSDRDKFLTEAMGGCWHDAAHPLYVCRCLKGCGAILNQPAWKPINTDFSTWEGFGKLWEWAIDQEWWFNFKTMHYLGMIPEFNPEISIINPDRFATAIYEYLKPKETP